MHIFVVFCLKHIGLRCKNQPFALQKIILLYFIDIQQITKAKI